MIFPNSVGLGVSAAQMSHVFFLGSASRRPRRLKSRLRARYARNGTPRAQGCKNCRGPLRSAYAAQFPFHRGYASYESCRCRLCGGYAALCYAVHVPSKNTGSGEVPISASQEPRLSVGLKKTLTDDCHFFDP